METMITTWGVTSIVAILMVTIPAIVNFIKWCKGLYAEREAFKKEHFKKGQKAEHKSIEEENRFSQGEKRIAALENVTQQILEKIDKLTRNMDLYLESDQLDIKAWLKEQHEKWMHKGAIDSHSLDLVNRRFAIYTKEDGNGWAKKMVEDINKLPVITAIPATEV